MTIAHRKRFGQHFLHDKNIIREIIFVIAPKPDDVLVEIGPGIGALTAPILKKVGTLTAIEIDWDIVPELKTRCEDKGELIVHQADALDFDFSSLVRDQRPLRIFGNLPYNISTPLIFHLLSYVGQIADMHFMLQKEVVERLAAQPREEHYGRLSVMVQYHAAVRALFDVPPSAFHPPPRVDSSIVRIVPYKTVPFIANNYATFSHIVKQAFSQRRKTLRNCLKGLVSDAIWSQSKIDSQQRPEELSVESFVRLSNLI